jgi:transposase
VNDVPPIYRCSIGLDVHQSQITACAIIGKSDGTTEVVHKRFGAYQRDRRALSEWASSLKPEIVVMESTGIYWKSPYAALEKVGICAWVVNARHVKQVPGRKTDINDAHWLAILGRSGLLRKSFVLRGKCGDLRIVARQRKKLVGALSAEKNRLHKILTDGGIRLSVVVSDLNGVSARKMIEALINKKPPQEVLAYASDQLKAKKEDILEALHGELTNQQIFVLKEILSHIKDLELRIQRFETEMLYGLKDEVHILEALQTIPGVDLISAASILVEIGSDMEEFGSAEKLASWAGLCPGNNETAGKKKAEKRAKGIIICAPYCANALMQPEEHNLCSSSSMNQLYAGEEKSEQ